MAARNAPDRDARREVDQDTERCRRPLCRTRPEPGYASRGLCLRCEAAGLDAITELVADHADLQPLVWDKLAAISAALSGFGPSEPINYAADILVREIAYTVGLWEIPVREAARLSDAPDHIDVERSVEILTAHYAALIALPLIDHLSYEQKITTGDGVDAVLACIDLHRRARSMLGITTKIIAEPGPCPACSHETLRHKNGANDVWCATCLYVMTWDEYQDTVSVVSLRRAA